MARKATQCSICEEIIWFGDLDQFGQSVWCNCGSCNLTETEIVGEHNILTPEQIEDIV